MIKKGKKHTEYEGKEMMRRKMEEIQ